MDLKQFKLPLFKEDKTGWLDRNSLIGEVMKFTGHSYWTVRSKTQHLSIVELSKILHDSKQNPKTFYWLAKQKCGKNIK